MAQWDVVEMEKVREKLNDCAIFDAVRFEMAFHDAGLVASYPGAPTLLEPLQSAVPERVNMVGLDYGYAQVGLATLANNIFETAAYYTRTMAEVYQDVVGMWNEAGVPRVVPNSPYGPSTTSADALTLPKFDDRYDARLVRRTADHPMGMSVRNWNAARASVRPESVAELDSRLGGLGPVLGEQLGGPMTGIATAIDLLAPMLLAMSDASDAVTMSADVLFTSWTGDGADMAATMFTTINEWSLGVVDDFQPLFDDVDVKMDALLTAQLEAANQVTRLRATLVAYDLAVAAYRQLPMWPVIAPMFGQVFDVPAANMLAARSAYVTAVDELRISLEAITELPSWQ